MARAKTARAETAETANAHRHDPLLRNVETGAVVRTVRVTGRY